MLRHPEILSQKRVIDPVTYHGGNVFRVTASLSDGSVRRWFEAETAAGAVVPCDDKAQAVQLLRMAGGRS